MFRVICNIVSVDEKGYTSTLSVPTFDLDANIHGLVSTEAAEKLAARMLRDIIEPFDGGQLKHIAVSAVRIGQ